MRFFRAFDGQAKRLFPKVVPTGRVMIYTYVRTLLRVNVEQAQSVCKDHALIAFQSCYFDSTLIFVIYNKQASIQVCYPVAAGPPGLHGAEPPRVNVSRIGSSLDVAGT